MARRSPTISGRTRRSQQHYANASVRLQAWNDWADKANSFVVPANVWVTPANGSTSASTRVVLVVEFNEPMVGTTITTSTWTVASNAIPITGTVAYNPITWAATFTPTSILAGGSAVVSQVTTGVKNAQGVAIANPIVWSFDDGLVASRNETVVSRDQPTAREGDDMSRDRDVRNAIQAALLRDGRFDAVWIWGLPEDYGTGGSSLAAAAIEPSSSDQSDRWDDVPGGGLVVTSLVTITLLIAMKTLSFGTRRPSCSSIRPPAH